MAAEQPTMVAGGGRFAAACGLLRQYMMEHGRRGRGGVTMGLVPAAQAVAAVAPEERIDKTMELFPQQPGALKLKNSSHQRSRILEPGRAQLTIFYGGCTIAFDDFPADKADELMLLASSFVAPDDADDDTAAAEPVCPDVLAQLQPFLADMPVARKASLRRFLDKRKSRLAAADPYPVPPAREGKDKQGKPPVEAPWLAVNSRLYLN